MGEIDELRTEIRALKDELEAELERVERLRDTIADLSLENAELRETARDARRRTR